MPSLALEQRIAKWKRVGDERGRTAEAMLGPALLSSGPVAVARQPPRHTTPSGTEWPPPSSLILPLVRHQFPIPGDHHTLEDA